jgi:hypothetical protein
MEGETLIPADSCPPPALEKFVLCLIPPAARESVAGDLCELYRDPKQYIGEALRTVPFIVASQVRRTVNLPVMGLKGLLLLAWFASLMPPALAVAATAAVLVASCLMEAYRGNGRPSVRGALVTAVAAGAAAELCALFAAHLLRPDWQTLPYFAFFGPMMVPVLCLLRTIVIVWHDPHVWASRSVPSLEMLRGDYEKFARRTAWHARLEAGALSVIALAIAGFEGGGGVVVVLYLLAALYLLVGGDARAMPAGMNFAGLRTHFERELARQHRLNSLVWWLWAAPLFLLLQEGLGHAAQRPLSVLGAIALALPAGFFIESLDRERRGQALEEAYGRAAEHPVS